MRINLRLAGIRISGWLRTTGAPFLAIGGQGARTGLPGDNPSISFTSVSPVRCQRCRCPACLAAAPTRIAIWLGLMPRSGSLSSTPRRTDDNELHDVGAHNAEPDLPDAHTAGNAGRPLQVSPDQHRRLATRSLASRIRPIIATSTLLACGRSSPVPSVQPFRCAARTPSS